MIHIVECTGHPPPPGYSHSCAGLIHITSVHIASSISHPSILHPCAASHIIRIYHTCHVQLDCSIMLAACTIQVVCMCAYMSCASGLQRHAGCIWIASSCWLHIAERKNGTSLRSTFKEVHAQHCMHSLAELSKSTWICSHCLLTQRRPTHKQEAACSCMWCRTEPYKSRTPLAFSLLTCLLTPLFLPHLPSDSSLACFPSSLAL